MAPNTSLSFDFFEYGKLFLPLRASEFQTLVASDPEFTRSGVGRTFEVNVLNFPERAPFAATVGNVSVALVSIIAEQYRTRAGQYCLVQIQRRNELELLTPEERSKSNAARRDFNQVRYTFLTENDLKALIEGDRSYPLGLLSDEKRRGGAGEPYRLADFRAGEGQGDGQPEIRPRFAPLLETSPRPSGATDRYARAIAHELLRRSETSPGSAAQLRILAPELNPPDPALAIETKADVLRRAQWLVYPRHGIMTWAFDYVTQREAIDVLLLNAPIPGLSGVVSLDELVRRLETQPDRNIIRLLDLEHALSGDSLFRGLLAEKSEPLDWVLATGDELRSGKNLTLARVIKLLSLPRLAPRRNEILRRLAREELSVFVAQPGLEKDMRLAGLDDAGERLGWNLAEYAPFQNALPADFAREPEARARLARAVSLSPATALAQIPSGFSGPLAAALLDLYTSDGSAPRFKDQRSIPAALLADAAFRPPFAVLLNASDERAAQLLDTCLVEIRQAGRPDDLDWLIKAAPTRIDPAQLAELLLAWLDGWRRGSNAPQGATKALINILTEYNRRRDDQSEAGLLSRWRAAPQGPRLSGGLEALALGDGPGAVEAYFFAETAYLPFNDFAAGVLRLQSVLTQRLPQVRAHCSRRFQRIVLPPDQRPTEPPPADEASPEHMADKLFYFRLRTPGQLAPVDVEEQVDLLPNEQPWLRLDHSMIHKERREVARSIDPDRARRWLELAVEWRRLTPALIETLGGLHRLNDAFVEYYLTRIVGYDNAPAFMARASAWWLSPGAARLSERTRNLLKATDWLKELPQPPDLSRPFLDLLGGNSDWTQWDAQPDDSLVAAIVDLWTAAPPGRGVSVQLWQLLRQFQESPARLRGYLRRTEATHPGGWTDAAATWEKRVAEKTMPPDHPDREHLRLAWQVMASPVGNKTFSEAEMDVLAGRADWATAAPQGASGATVGRFVALAQLGMNSLVASRARQALEALADSRFAPSEKGVPVEQRAYWADLLAARRPALPAREFEPALGRPTVALPPEPAERLKTPRETEWWPKESSPPPSDNWSEPALERNREYWLPLIGCMVMIILILVAVLFYQLVLR